MPDTLHDATLIFWGKGFAEIYMYIHASIHPSFHPSSSLKKKADISLRELRAANES